MLSGSAAPDRAREQRRPEAPRRTLSRRFRTACRPREGPRRLAASFGHDPGGAPADVPYAGVRPRSRSERRRSSSTVVSSRTERITSTVATARIVGLISWRMPAHICLGRVS